jgi:protein TonB
MVFWEMAMNTTASVETAILASLLTLGVTSAPSALAADVCTPRVMQSPADFPSRAELRGQSGTVFLEVTVDENGHAMDARLHKSSGHRLLDRAAAASVRDSWIFDVSGCERKDLPANQVISVEYRNPEYED